MKFSTLFTPLEPISFPKHIHFSDQILSLGSCFAQEIGNELKAHQQQVCVNPAGVLFNPISVLNLIRRSFQDFKFETNRVVQKGDLYYHYDYHSDVFGETKMELKDKIWDCHQTIKKTIENSAWLFLTWGTSMIYEFENQPVANCHKQAPSNFNQVALQTSMLTKAFEDCYNIVKKNRPKLNILLTTSPVRHSKDGLITNNRSKATLQLLNQELCSRFDDVFYFPSYEILMDVLRDYRFYKSDLIHPNQQAIAVVWKYFSESLLAKDDDEKYRLGFKLHQMNQHNLQHPKTKESLKFIEKRKTLELKLKALKLV